MVTWRRFNGYINNEDPDFKLHLVELYQVKNPSWNRVPNTHTLIVPTGDLELIAKIDLKQVVEAYRNKEKHLILEAAKPYLQLRIDDNGMKVLYDFKGIRPISTTAVPLIEYHILELAGPAVSKWLGHTAFFRQDATCKPVGFKHIRYTKENFE